MGLGWEHYATPKKESERIEEATRSLQYSIEYFERLIQRAEDMTRKLEEILDQNSDE